MQWQQGALFIWYLIFFRGLIDFWQTLQIWYCERSKKTKLCSSYFGFIVAHIWCYLWTILLELSRWSTRPGHWVTMSMIRARVTSWPEWPVKLLKTDKNRHLVYKFTHNKAMLFYTLKMPKKTIFILIFNITY